MQKYMVKKYQVEDFDSWNTFVNNSKNGTFLFHRNFMEYHKHNFKDASLMFYDKNEKLVALLPLNKEDEKVFSHKGLTYGGFIIDANCKISTIKEIYELTISYLKSIHIKDFYYSMIPNVYCSNFNDELHYLLFQSGAVLEKMNTLSVVDLKAYPKWSKDRMQGVKRGEKNNLRVVETNDFTLFWNEILIPNLNKKHNVKPVHSLLEITKLKSLFPNKIRQFNVYKDDLIVAGTTIFETKKVAHSQYISGNEDKNLLGSLDCLHSHLLKTVFKEKTFFDFGTSNEKLGTQINKGLHYWKEGFGARTQVQFFYKLDLEKIKPLDSLFV